MWTERPFGADKPRGQVKHLDRITLLLGRRKGGEASKARARVHGGWVQASSRLGAQGRRTSDRLRELGAKPLQLSKTNMFSSYDNMIKLETL